MSDRALAKKDECVRVMVRIRPPSSKELQDGRQIVAIADFDRADIKLCNPSGTEGPKSFTYDAAFGSESTQQQVYDTAAIGIVEAVMEGYNGTIFAYGQVQCLTMSKAPTLMFCSRPALENHTQWKELPNSLESFPIHSNTFSIR